MKFDIKITIHSKTGQILASRKFTGLTTSGVKKQIDGARDWCPEGGSINCEITNTMPLL